MNDPDVQLVNEFFRLLELGRDTSSFMNEVRERVFFLLRNTGRSSQAFSRLKHFMLDNGYFTTLGALKYHLSVPGGLAIHSLSVLNTFSKLCQDYRHPVPEDTLISASLLHDICKCKNHVWNGERWEYSKDPNCIAHSSLSLSILDSLEYPISGQTRNLIKYHMGLYGSLEFNGRYSEFPLHDFVDASNQDLSITLFHMADMLSSKFVEKSIPKQE